MIARGWGMLSTAGSCSNSSNINTDRRCSRWHRKNAVKWTESLPAKQDWWLFQLPQKYFPPKPYCTMVNVIPSATYQFQIKLFGVKQTSKQSIRTIVEFSWSVKTFPLLHFSISWKYRRQVRIWMLSMWLSGTAKKELPPRYQSVQIAKILSCTL